MSLLHKGPTEGHTELGEPQDGTTHCHITDHCPRQGSPVPVPLASPAQESQITVLVSGQIFTEFLTGLFSQFVMSICAGMCSGTGNPTGCTRKETQQPNEGVGVSFSHAGSSPNLPSSPCTARCCRI